MSGASSPPPSMGSPSTRLFPAPGNATRTPTRPNHDRAAQEILSSSIKGWNPLQINKRTESPTKPLNNSDAQSSVSDASSSGPRRTSSSFKHVKSNSLVSNSIFKSPVPPAANPQHLQSTKHLSFTDGKMTTSDSSNSLSRSGSSGSIGLGISATRRTPSISRKTSSSKANTPSGSRRVSNGTERKVSGGALSALDHSPENADNNSPDVRSSASRKPRQSMGFKGLAKGALVSKSPFRQQDEERKSPEKLGSPIKLSGSPGRHTLEGGSPVKSTPPNFSGSPARFSSPSVPAKDDVFTSPTTLNAASILKSAAQAASNPYRQSPLSASITTNNKSKIGTTQESRTSDVLPFPSSVESPSPPNTPTRGLDYGRAISTPTPTKSSITQRRLRGPRLSGCLDSPGDRKQKTVTFRDGPVDVKEFDRESVTDQGSEARYGSDGEDEGDDGMHIGNYAPRHHADGSGGGMLVMDESEDGHSDYYRSAVDESTTANFIDSLVEDGYFSPPPIDSLEMGDFDMDATCSIQDKLESIPRLDTPSLGGSISATPLQEDMPFPMPPARDEVDEHGIPYGRTHHSERAAAAHAAEAKSSVHMLQPALPREGTSSGMPLLRTANAAEPYLQNTAATHKESAGPHAHQQGTFIDPFVTIQTATKVYNSSASATTDTQPRQEGGVPLGRTSHIERNKVARLMATQSLGLGMPRRPVIPSFMENGDNISEDGSFQFEESDDDADYSAGQGHTVTMIEETNRLASPAPLFSPVTSQRQASDASDEVYYAPSNRSSYIATSVLSPVGTPTSRRSLPKPPHPQQIDIPEPVNARGPSPEIESDAPERAKPSNLALPFSLPSIGHSSPLFASSAFVPSSSESEQSDLREERPQTPPKVADTAPQIVSPTRIPDFDFETDQNHSFGDISSDLSTSQAFKMVEDALPPMSPPVGPAQRSIFPSPVKGASPPVSRPSSGESQITSTGSTTGRIRQRISRDMIRQKLEVRKVQSESRTGDSVQASITSGIPGDLSIIEKNLISGEKALPAPPTEWISTTANKRSASPAADKERPKMAPREQSKSAQEVLQQAQRDGNMHDPKSALDRLVSNFSSASMDDSARSTPAIVKASFSSSNANPKMVSDMTPAAGKRVSSLRPTEQDGDKSPFQDAPSTPVKDRAPGRREPSMTKVESATKPRRKRSLSASEARQRGQRANRMSMTLDQIKLQDDRSIMNAIEDEMEHIASDRPYRIREQRQKIIARSDDKVNHNGAGDLDTGRAWRQLRRPSDINQYAAELRAIKATKSVSSKFGTIFVKVLGIESLNLPMPSQPTAFCVTLDNGIDYIRTNYSTLKEGARVNQEFALVEHANFEFALGLEIRRDPHIIKMVHDNMHQGAAASTGDTASVSSTRSHGFKNLFSSPRKASKAPLRQVQITDSAKVEENICRYFGTGDSTVARTHIAFNPIAKECDARILEIRYPMFGIQKMQAMASILRKPAVEGLPPPPAPVPEKKLLAKITLQIFRLPPLPGLSHDQLPQSIDDCLRGMRHHTWHEQEHLEGILTQRGGDCTVPRRRPFRLLGSSLIASNPVTKKEVFSVDMRQLKLAEDNNTADRAAREEDEGVSPMPRSFRLVFKNGEDIVFSADSDLEKQKWLAAFASLVDRGIPSNPLWAEVLASQQRQARDDAR